jgi:hypothetical protein
VLRTIYEGGNSPEPATAPFFPFPREPPSNQSEKPPASASPLPAGDSRLCETREIQVPGFSEVKVYGLTEFMACKCWESELREFYPNGRLTAASACHGQQSRFHLH